MSRCRAPFLPCSAAADGPPSTSAVHACLCSFPSSSSLCPLCVPVRCCCLIRLVWLHFTRRLASPRGLFSIGFESASVLPFLEPFSRCARHFSLTIPSASIQPSTHSLTHSRQCDASGTVASSLLPALLVDASRVASPQPDATLTPLGSTRLDSGRGGWTAVGCAKPKRSSFPARVHMATSDPSATEQTEDDGASGHAAVAISRLVGSASATDSQ